MTDKRRVIGLSSILVTRNAPGSWNRREDLALVVSGFRVCCGQLLPCRITSGSPVTQPESGVPDAGQRQTRVITNIKTHSTPPLTLCPMIGASQTPRICAGRLRELANEVVGMSQPGSLAHCMDDNCDVNGNSCSRAGDVHQDRPAASLLNGGDTVSAEWKKQDDRGSQSWVIASGNDRLGDVNGAIQENQIDGDKSEPGTHPRCQCQRDPDDAPHSGHVNDEDSQR